MLRQSGIIDVSNRYCVAIKASDAAFVANNQMRREIACFET